MLMRAVGVAVSVVLLFAVSVAVQAARDRAYPLATTPQTLLYLQSGPAVEKLSLSFDAVVADLYWIRAIQHYGDERLRGGTQRFGALYPLLDIATSLDPRFAIAYRFGAFFLAEPFPGGAGRADLAIELLEKGLRAQPTKWEYAEDIGFVYYWQLQDFKQAAAAFSRAADIPGAPWWLRPLAATTLTKGGQREASRFLWQQMFESAGDDWQRRAARNRLLQLDALDAIDQLRVVVDRYMTGNGHPPASWSVLVQAGMLRALPQDPAGTPYLLDPDNGFVTVSQNSPLFPLPVEPPASQAP